MSSENGAHPEVYLYHTTKYPPACPSARDNLQSLFRLDDLAASVARVDAQGNKIIANKLGKTYKKQLIDLGVPGAPEIPKNKFIMGLLMAGIAYQETSEVSYDIPRDSVLQESFYLQPGKLAGYVKYTPSSPMTTIRRPDSKASPQPVVVPRVSIFPGSNSYKLVPNRPATPEVKEEVVSAGDESSDDGSRFKQLERERKKKLKSKREAEGLYGDQKRRRYDES